ERERPHGPRVPAESGGQGGEQGFGRVCPGRGHTDEGGEAGAGGGAQSGGRRGAGGGPAGGGGGGRRGRGGRHGGRGGRGFRWFRRRGSRREGVRLRGGPCGVPATAPPGRRR